MYQHGLEVMLFGGEIGSILRGKYGQLRAITSAHGIVNALVSINRTYVSHRKCGEHNLLYVAFVVVWCVHKNRENLSCNDCD
jgi:hypothetical protein